MQIWKYTNIRGQCKCKCRKCKRVSKESKYLYMKKYNVRSNRNVNKQANKQNKEKHIYIRKKKLNIKTLQLYSCRTRNM